MNTQKLRAKYIKFAKQYQQVCADAPYIQRTGSAAEFKRECMVEIQHHMKIKHPTAKHWVEAADMVVYGAIAQAEGLAGQYC